MFMIITRVCLTLLLLTRVITASVSIGMEITESKNGDRDLLSDIDLVHQKMYSLNDLNDIKNSKILDDFNNQISKIINNYLINNSCLRFYLNEYSTLENVLNMKNSKINNGLLVSINVDFSDTDFHIDQNRQTININILDKDGNTLRRINKVNNDKLNLLIDYPIHSENLEIYKQQYFDFCFENLKHDKSWNSVINSIFAKLDLSFGMETIKEKYKESSVYINDISSKLDKIYLEIDAITDQLVENLKTSEPLLRNKNEDTLEKYMKYVIITLIIYIIVNICQISWLIRYLKSHGLI